MNQYSSHGEFVQFGIRRKTPDLTGHVEIHRSAGGSKFGCHHPPATSTQRWDHGSE